VAIQPGDLFTYLGGVHAEVTALLANGRVLLRALPQTGITVEALRGLGWTIFSYPLPGFLGGGKVYRIIGLDELEALVEAGKVTTLTAEDREKSRPQANAS
jgi:hypothetical protein